jgi:hypothetical protein
MQNSVRLEALTVIFFGLMLCCLGPWVALTSWPTGAVTLTPVPWVVAPLVLNWGILAY